MAENPSIYTFLAKTFSVAYNCMLEVGVCPKLVTANVLTCHGPAQASRGKQKLPVELRMAADSSTSLLSSTLGRPVGSDHSHLPVRC